MVSAKECTSFASRVRWLSGNIFGRVSGLAIKTLLAHGGRSSREAPLSASLRWAISWILHNVPKAAPKVWSCERAAKCHLFSEPVLSTL